MQRFRPPEPQARPPVPEVETLVEDDAAEEAGACPDTVEAGVPATRTVLLNFGIHQASIPATGMTVAQVRETFGPLMNIDPEAVAVISGEIVEVEDERIISEEVEMLSFVKKSSVKGLAGKPGRIELVNGTARVHLARSVREVSTGSFIETIRRHAVHGMVEEPLPSCVRWRIDCGPTTIFIVELEPELRHLRWLSPESRSPYGPGAVYQGYRLATPYVVLKVPFRSGEIHRTCELFYRNAPLDGLDNPLSWCNLMNVSPAAYGCTSWVCTQFLDVELLHMAKRLGRKLGVLEQLDAFVKHLWGGGFNRSSEEHEGRSCFSKATDDAIDERVTDVERWQAASTDDWRFILDIDWLPAHVTVRDLITGQLAAFDQPVDLANTAELTNLIIARKRRVRKGASA